MVVGIHGRSGLMLPEFPEGCSAFFDHVAPTRIRRLGGEFIGYVKMTELSERRHQPLDANKAGGEMRVVIVNDVVIEIAHDDAATLCGRKVKRQGHGIGGLRACRVSACIRMEVFAIDSVLDLASQL